MTETDSQDRGAGLWGSWLWLLFLLPLRTQTSLYTAQEIWAVMLCGHEALRANSYSSCKALF